MAESDGSYPGEGGLQGKYRVGVYRVATREKALQGKYRVGHVRHVTAKWERGYPVGGGPPVRSGFYRVGVYRVTSAG